MGRLCIAVTNALGSSLDPLTAFMNSSGFYAPLKNSLVLDRGTGSPTFTRADASECATFFDHEGVNRKVPANCARFTGARMVRNLIPTTSEDITNAAWTKTNTTATGSVSDPQGGASACTITATAINGECYIGYPSVVGRTYVNSTWIRRRTGTGAVTYRNPNNAAVTITPTSSWQRFTTNATAVSTTCYIVFVLATSGDAIDVAFSMAQDKTGASDPTVPDDYVSVGVLSAPYHGAGVDGIKYFTTTNGNSVASNVVTEAAGTAIADATLDGFRPEGVASINRCLYSNDFSNAAWVASNVTKGADNHTAPDGTATAYSLTATAGNGTVIQDLGVVASASKTGGFYLKRKTGTGNIDITMDGGTGWTTVAVTSTWTRFEKNQTLADEDFGIRIVTSGDAVYVWNGQVQTATFLASPITTTSAAITRAADALSWPTTSNFSDTAGTIYFEAEASSWANASGRIVGDAAEGILASSANSGIQGYDGTNTVNGTAGSPSGQIKAAISWTGTTMKICVDGGAVASGTYDGAWNLSAIFIGNGFFGNIRNVRIAQVAYPGDVLQAATR